MQDGRENGRITVLGLANRAVARISHKLKPGLPATFKAPRAHPYTVNLGVATGPSTGLSSQPSYHIHTK